MKAVLYRSRAHTACRVFGMATAKHGPSILCKRLVADDVTGAWDAIKRQSDVQLFATRKGEYMVSERRVREKWLV